MITRQARRLRVGDKVFENRGEIFPVTEVAEVPPVTKKYARSTYLRFAGEARMGCYNYDEQFGLEGTVKDLIKGDVITLGHPCEVRKNFQRGQGFCEVTVKQLGNGHVTLWRGFNHSPIEHLYFIK